MKLKHALGVWLVAASLAGCAETPEQYPLPPAGPSPMYGATVQAAIDCAGPYVAWDRVTQQSLFPYRIEVSEKMRCLRDGRVVGPYVYRTDGLQ